MAFNVLNSKSFLSHDQTCIYKMAGTSCAGETSSVSTIGLVQSRAPDSGLEYIWFARLPCTFVIGARMRPRVAVEARGRRGSCVPKRFSAHTWAHTTAAFNIRLYDEKTPLSSPGAFHLHRLGTILVQSELALPVTISSNMTAVLKPKGDSWDATVAHVSSDPSLGSVPGPVGVGPAVEEMAMASNDMGIATPPNSSTPPPSTKSPDNDTDIIMPTPITPAVPTVYEPKIIQTPFIHKLYKYASRLPCVNCCHMC